MADDLRDWLQKVEGVNELKRIDGADWDLEIGCLTELNWKRQNGPALLFDRIKGYPEGFRILTCSIMNPTRNALTLGVPWDGSEKTLFVALREKIPQWQARLHEFAPKVVKSGPLLENVQLGKDVNLFSFPVPKWHELDGGRYIGTGDAVITRNPDTGEINLGCYRVQVHDERTTGLYIDPAHHGRLDYQKYHERGEPCPVAVSVGHHPLIFRAAALHIPAGTEYQYIGAIRQEPVEVLEEEVTGLPVPADSEIVIAGWIPPNKTRIEGPFGEATGYYASGERANPIVEVERIYHRNDPIILGSPPGKPPHDYSYSSSLMASLLLEADLRNCGVPDVRGVWVHPVGCGWLIAVSIKQRYAGHAMQAALLASEIKGARYLIVVDEDVVVSDIRDVMWAVSTRSDPQKDITIIDRVRSIPLDPTIRKPAESFFMSRAIIDACKPYDWIKEFPEAVESSPALVSRVTERWGDILDLSSGHGI